jgi:iron complex outermembrane receptor protein
MSQSIRMSNLAVAVSLGISTTALYAQEDAEPQARSALMQEVVVTARKRAAGEAVQDTPIAMTAFGEEQFKAVFADDLQDLGRLAPNVELKSSSQVGVQNFHIRGMGVTGTTPSDQPAVGVFQNGVFWGMNYGSLLDQFDVQSVEILRGPQGTLFGRNVTGGAVLVQTKRPEVGEGFGFAAEGIYGSYGRRDISVAVEGDIIEDTLAGRLVVLDRNLDGYYDNLVTGKDFGESNTSLVRGTLVWQPVDDVQATLIVDTYEDDGDSTAAIAIERPGNLPDQLGFDQSEDWWDIQLNDPGESDVEVDTATLEVTWDVGQGVVTSISGYRETDIFNWTDFDGTPIVGFNQSISYEQDQFSQELRYASNLADWGQFTVGAYYFEQEQKYREGRELALGALVFATASKLEQESTAVFGEIDFNFADNWTFTLGGRYTQETIDAQTRGFVCPLDNSIADATVRIRTFLPCDLGPTADDDWNDFSPKLALTWEPDENQLVYGSATRGFRSGGFSMRGNELLPPFDSEQVTAFEVGYKGDMLDNRLRLNLAIYHNEFDDLQRTILVPSVTAGVVQSTGNAAQATIQGLEADIVLQATDDLTFTFAYGYTDASYDKFEGLDVDGDGASDPDLAADLDFPRVPDETYSATANYLVPLGDAGDLAFRASWSRVGAQYHDDLNNIREPAYELWDASVTYTDPSAQWTVAVFGKNLGNEEYSIWGATLGALGENRFVGAPRTAGIRVSYEY